MIVRPRLTLQVKNVVVLQLQLQISLQFSFWLVLINLHLLPLLDDARRDDRRPVLYRKNTWTLHQLCGDCHKTCTNFVHNTSRGLAVSDNINFDHICRHTFTCTWDDKVEYNKFLHPPLCPSCLAWPDGVGWVHHWPSFPSSSVQHAGPAVGRMPVTKKRQSRPDYSPYISTKLCYYLSYQV